MGSSHEDLADALMRRVHQATSALGRQRNAVHLARYLFSVRHELGHAAVVIKEADPERHEELMRQAEISYLTARDRFATTSRANLLETWTGLLVDAVRKLDADEAKAERYAEIADERAEAGSTVKTASARRLGRGNRQRA